MFLVRGADAGWPLRVEVEGQPAAPQDVRDDVAFIVPSVPLVRTVLHGTTRGVGLLEASLSLGSSCARG